MNDNLEVKSAIDFQAFINLYKIADFLNRVNVLHKDIKLEYLILKRL